MTRLLREHPRPSIDVETMHYGLRITALRALDSGHTHVRVTNLAFPNAFVIPMSAGMTITQWHVPIDRTSCYWYAYFTSFTDPVDHHKMRAQRLELYELPEYRARKGRHNRYGFDPFEQQTSTYTGMGADINVHDQWAVESQGAVQDRTREHLGYSDKAIVANRRLLVAAIEQVAQGKIPQMGSIEASTQTKQGPIAIDAVLQSDTWQADVARLDAERRAKASWSAAADAA